MNGIEALADIVDGDPSAWDWDGAIGRPPSVSPSGVDSEFFDARIGDPTISEHRCEHAFNRALHGLAARLPDQDGQGLVVDVGCGTAPFAPLALAAGFRYLGVDMSRQSLEIAAERNPGALFLSCGYQDVGFRDDSAAAFVFTNFLHHIPDPVPTLADMRRALRPGGRVIGFEPNFLSPYGMAGWAKNFSADRRICFYNHWSLRGRLARAGFETFDVWGINLFPCFFPGPRLERFYDWVEDHCLNGVTAPFAVHQALVGEA